MIQTELRMRPRSSELKKLDEAIKAQDPVPMIIPFCQRHNKRPAAHPIAVKDGAVLCKTSMALCDK